MTLEHTTCLGCGCCCDDIAVVVRGERIVEAQRACGVGKAWFGDGSVPGAAMTAGTARSVDDAIDAAARLLMGARRPLVFLAPDLPCETQREAVGIADRLSCAIDSVTSSTAQASILAAQERGRASATLGEVRNRADLILFWGVDPALRYAGFPSRYAPDAAGLHVPDGRRSRTVVAVDVGAERGPADADHRAAVAAADDVALLTALGAIVRNPELKAAGPLWDTARSLATRLTAARYVAIVVDGEPPADGTTRDAGRGQALIALAQALNTPTRAALVTLRAGGNRTGADAVLTAQTGYPFAVDFTRGFPRYTPRHGNALARLTDGEVDAVLVVGSVAALPPALGAALGAVPCVVIGPRASTSALSNKEVVIDTGLPGIHEGGTVLRLDDVPLPLRPSLAAPITTGDAVTRLRNALGTSNIAATGAAR